ncbi:MAG: ATP-binding protein, partial [Pararhizobium sp.]
YPLRIEITYPGGRVVAANFRGMPDDGFVVTMTDVTPQIQAARMLEQSNEALEARVQERTAELMRLNDVLQDEVLKHQKTAEALEKMRKAAEAANLGKTRFLAAASHDLLQPLNSARLYLTALETSRFVAPEAHDLMEKIGFAFQSTEALLSTILDISKMDAGGYQLKLSNVDVDAMFRGLAMEFDALARQRGVALRVVASATVVRSDAHLLRRILQNFLSNAIKYTERGSVLLGARRHAGTLSIEVHDTGPGIAVEHREAIFEEFRRAAPPSSPVRGLGLGLAIVRRAAELLDHPVHLRSEVGRGSCFSIDVPLVMDRRPPAVPAIMPSAPVVPILAGAEPPAAENGHLFVLENDETVANAMTTLFDHWHLKSVVAPSYPALLEIVERQALSPDAIIADLHLDGDIDGIDAIILLREHLGRDLPGILVTADQSIRIKERAKAKRIEYFSKPLKPAQLRAYLFHLSREAGRAGDLSAEPSA